MVVVLIPPTPFCVCDPVLNALVLGGLFPHPLVTLLACAVQLVAFETVQVMFTVLPEDMAGGLSLLFTFKSTTGAGLLIGVLLGGTGVFVGGTGVFVGPHEASTIHWDVVVQFNGFVVRFCNLLFAAHPPAPHAPFTHTPKVQLGGGGLVGEGQHNPGLFTQFHPVPLPLH